MPQRAGQPRCRCRTVDGQYEVVARVERFVEPAVLLLLREGASYGYELADALEALLDEGRVDFGNLYRLLRALEEEGVVRSSWSDDTPGPMKRVYEITEEGVALLEAWTASLRVAQERVTVLLDRYEIVRARFQSAE
ncbi:MAG: PadR family transcriptional regulator [Acidimicrobiales bacterium]